MFYAFIRGLVSLALPLFYRVKVNAPAAEPEGPVIFVCNHPNGLIDPALVFVITHRRVTFLAKAPLFKLPVIGWILKGLEALPVYRKQDDPTQMRGNEGTLEAARTALVKGRAITIFPEGRSHSEPMLARAEDRRRPHRPGRRARGSPGAHRPGGLHLRREARLPQRRAHRGGGRHRGAAFPQARRRKGPPRRRKPCASSPSASPRGSRR